MATTVSRIMNRFTQPNRWIWTLYSASRGRYVCIECGGYVC